MPVISFANSKGGSGKSTSALLIACELAESVDVILIDADPRRPLVAWAKAAGNAVPDRLQVIESAGQTGILDEIEKAAAEVPFVLIDLEGTASRLVSYAIGQSDLVLIPAREQHQDAQAALDTHAEILRDAKAVRRPISAAIVLTQTRVAVKPRTARHVAAQLRDSGRVRVLKTEIAERDAYSAIFATAQPLRSLDPTEVNNIPAAIDNVRRLVDEVLDLFKPAAAETPAKPATAAKPKKLGGQK